MESISFPFIMEFIRSFKDQNTIFFLMEFVKGEELFDSIRHIGYLGTTDSKFYAASLILSLEYLHSKNIIYRDIKPENIMVDYKVTVHFYLKGYIKMIDMGTAKFLKKGKKGGARTFTIIGTPHYMAPEIINGKGYSFSVDLWSVGICLYEFMCGGVPFGEDADDPYQIYEEIVRNPLKFPSLKDKKAKSLMNQLLNKVPDLRLNGSYAKLKAHPWFDNFDWDKLYEKKMEAPHIPPNVISDKDLENAKKKNVQLVDELKNDSKHSKHKKIHPRDINWDKDF